MLCSVQQQDTQDGVNYSIAFLKLSGLINFSRCYVENIGSSMPPSVVWLPCLEWAVHCIALNILRRFREFSWLMGFTAWYRLLQSVPMP